jgi:VanZ family protein
MDELNSDRASRPPQRKWLNRILAASLFGVFFFTLFPYWIDINVKSPGTSHPFFLGSPPQFGGVLHTLLNTLLFVPFGFALSGFARARGTSRLKSLGLALVAGAFLSYAIELVQIYIPARDSAWDDVFSNTLGSFLGMALGFVMGDFILHKLVAWETQVESWLIFPRITAVSILYFGIWLAVSIPLQRQSRLNNWDPDSFLTIGNDARGESPWEGQAFRIRLWNRALRPEEVSELGSPADPHSSLNSGLLGAYDFSHSPPILDETSSLPPLVLELAELRAPAAHQSHRGRAKPLLVSESPVTKLSRAVQATNQFTVLFEGVPRFGEESEGTIVEASTRKGVIDFRLIQSGVDLAVEIRSALASRKSYLVWRVPRAFAPKEKFSIVFAYDGALGSLFLNGVRAQESYYLSPGAGLVRMLVRIKSAELAAYSVLYHSLVFLPMGILFGFAIRKYSTRKGLVSLVVLTGIILSSALLEGLLVWISGRQPSIMLLLLSVSIAFAGLIWINLDGLARG